MKETEIVLRLKTPMLTLSVNPYQDGEKLLENAVEKYRWMAGVLSEMREFIWGEYCPLCVVYSKRCATEFGERCPVFVQTDMRECQDTPWGSVRMRMRDLLDAVDKETVFLTHVKDYMHTDKEDTRRCPKSHDEDDEDDEDDDW